LSEALATRSSCSIAFSSAIFEDGRLLVAQMLMVPSAKTALARAFEMSYGAQLNSVLILCVHSI
jgi:hypothetical protein